LPTSLPGSTTAPAISPANLAKVSSGQGGPFLDSRMISALNHLGLDIWWDVYFGDYKTIRSWSVLIQKLASSYRWSGRPMAACRAATASDMMRQRHGLPLWAVGRSTMR
jgi:hypothetical protein